MVEEPQDRRDVARQLVEERLGGTLIDFYWCFGDYDAVMIYEAPSNVDAAAVALTPSIGRVLANIKTTVLLDSEERVEALRKAQSAVKGEGGE